LEQGLLATDAARCVSVATLAVKFIQQERSPTQDLVCVLQHVGQNSKIAFKGVLYVQVLVGAKSAQLCFSVASLSPMMGKNANPNRECYGLWFTA
jgi:hypothetical protein